MFINVRLYTAYIIYITNKKNNDQKKSRIIVLFGLIKLMTHALNSIVPTSAHTVYKPKNIKNSNSKNEKKKKVSVT